MTADPAWAWAAARRRGTSHARTGAPCQDWWRCLVAGDGAVLIAGVCDGAGSAPHGGAGAALALRALTDGARDLVERGGGLPDESALAELAGRARARIADVAAARGQSARDFATTALLAIADDRAIVSLHIGDGAIVTGDGLGWDALSWPEHGEYAATTAFLTDASAPRIARGDAAPARLALFSDGMERLALDFATKRPHAPFFDAMAAPVAASRAAGRDAALSGALGRFLDSERVTARTDDDKTLILAVRRCAAAAS